MAEGWLKKAKAAENFILDLLFPLECLGCGREGAWLCPACFRRLTFNPKQYCFHCKRLNSWGEFCPACRPFYYLDGLLVAGDYEDQVMARLIKNLKYHFAREVAAELAKFLILFLENELNIFRLRTKSFFTEASRERLNNLKSAPLIFWDFADNILMPVPLHPRRLRWRGFNQAEFIAKSLSEYFGLIIERESLIRTRYRRPQAELKERARRLNIADCFAWQGENLNKKNIILVDDVATTGSTLNECARVLKKAGAGEVWGLVAAKG